MLLGTEVFDHGTPSSLLHMVFFSSLGRSFGSFNMDVPLIRTLSSHHPIRGAEVAELDRTLRGIFGGARPSAELRPSRCCASHPADASRWLPPRWASAVGWRDCRDCRSQTRLRQRLMSTSSYSVGWQITVCPFCDLMKARTKPRYL